jgi:hypothetical protein
MEEVRADLSNGMVIQHGEFARTFITRLFVAVDPSLENKGPFVLIKHIFIERDPTKAATWVVHWRFHFMGSVWKHTREHNGFASAMTHFRVESTRW